MKKFLFLLIAGFCTVQLWAQTINFSVLPLPDGGELTEASRDMLQNKLKQIITRNSRVHPMNIMFLSLNRKSWW